MITWIQRNLQNKVFFLVLLAIVIVAFVFTIGAAPGIGSAQSKTLRREFFGLNLASQEDQQRLFRDASLSIELQAGFAALEGERLQQYALERHAALHLADQLNLPPPSNSELEAYIRTLRIFANEQGRFERKRYVDFLDGLRTNPQLTEADVSRVVLNDVRYRKVLELISGPGYVLPSDVVSQLVRSDAVWSLAIARLDPATINPDLTLTEEQITSFFEQNAFRYEIAPKVGVDFIEFPVETFLDQVTLTETALRAHFEAQPERFPKPAETSASFSLLVDGEDHFTAVKTDVENALRRQQATRLANQTVADLALALFDEGITRDSLPSFLDARQLSLQAADPFDRSGPPPQLSGARQAVSEAFRLTPQRPFSDAINTQRGPALLVWRESIPARTPELTEVRQAVSDDLAESLRRDAFSAAGAALRTAIKTQLETGTAFESAANQAASAAGLTLQIETPEPFSFNPPPRDFDFSLFNLLTTLKAGQLGEFIVGSQGKGLLVYALDKQIPDASPANPRFEETRLQLAAATANRSSSDYLRAMIETELLRTAPPGTF